MGKMYYLGLDIGTNSVGYAVTDPSYHLLKFKGEPMWGAHVFAAGNQSAERRSFRTSRRRLDRRQQRVKLVQEIFASVISPIDPRFLSDFMRALYGGMMWLKRINIFSLMTRPIRIRNIILTIQPSIISLWTLWKAVKSMTRGLFIWLLPGWLLIVVISSMKWIRIILGMS